MPTATAIDLSKKFRFREFQVYKDARLLSNQLRRLVHVSFPRSEQFVLTDQLCRAILSVLLNIAEGADRSTDKDFALFLNRAHTSLNEVVACLDVALDNQYIDASVHADYLQHCAALGNQLTAFRQVLIRNV